MKIFYTNVAKPNSGKELSMEDAMKEITSNRVVICGENTINSHTL
jgi:uncharacterized iron-regulated protein